MGRSVVSLLTLLVLVLTFIISTFRSYSFQFMSDLHGMFLNFLVLMLVDVGPFLLCLSQLVLFQGKHVSRRRIASTFFVGNAAIILGAILTATYGYKTIPAPWLENHVFFAFEDVPLAAIKSAALLNVALIYGLFMLVILHRDQVRLGKAKLA